MSSRWWRSAASASVLALVALAARAASAEGTRSSVTTEVKSEVAVYTDSDSVSVFTPSVSGSARDVSSGWSGGGSYLVDIVSAASVDIVSTASGRWTEVRHAGALHAGYKPYDLGGTVSGSVSREPDYLSLTGGAQADWDLAKKTITPALAYSFTHDTAGRAGTPFSVYSLELDRHTLAAELALVLDRESIVNVDFDAIFEVGHQEKPYRYVPMFAADVAPSVPAGASVDVVNALRLPGRVAERLPTTRQRYALSTRLGQRLADSTLIVKERLYADSWGLKATTTDLRLVFDLSRRLFVWPEARIHFQSGVSFWRLAYVADASADGSVDVPALRTGDRELSPLSSASGGAGLHLNLGSAGDPSELGLTLLAQGTTTHFNDALFITQRFGIFSAIQGEARF